MARAGAREQAADGVSAGAGVPVVGRLSARARVAPRLGLAALVWGGSVLASRLVGLVREGVVGRVLGAGREADVLWAAFCVPDFLNYLLAGGALGIVCIPIFSSYLADGDERGADEALSRIATFLLLAIGVSLPLLWLAAGHAAGIVAPGFGSEDAAALARLTRIVLPAQLFHLLGGVLGAWLQARDRHALPAAAPIVYAVAVVAGGLLGGQAAGADGFAWGVLVGSALGPFGLPLFGCLRLGLRIRLRLDLRSPDLRRYLVRSLPIMLGVSIVVCDDWLLRRGASMLGAGSVALIQYAKTLLRVPVGVFGLAVGAALFPSLSRLLSRGDHEAGLHLLGGALRRVLFLALGAQVVLTVAGADLARAIYGARIGLGGAQAIGGALGVLALGLGAWAAQALLSRGLYALGQTWIPTVAGSVVCLAALPLYSALRSRFGLPGLAAASAAAVTAYALLLWACLRWRIRGARVSLGVAATLGRLVPAAVGALGVGWGLRVALVGVDPGLWRGAALIGASGVVYVALAHLLGVPAVLEAWQIVRARLGALAARRSPGADTPSPARPGRKVDASLQVTRRDLCSASVRASGPTAEAPGPRGDRSPGSCTAPPGPRPRAPGCRSRRSPR